MDTSNSPDAEMVPPWEQPAAAAAGLANPNGPPSQAPSQDQEFVDNDFVL